MGDLLNVPKKIGIADCIQHLKNNLVNIGINENNIFTNWSEEKRVFNTHLENVPSAIIEVVKIVLNPINQRQSIFKKWYRSFLILDIYDRQDSIHVLVEKFISEFEYRFNANAYEFTFSDFNFRNEKEDIRGCRTQAMIELS